MCADKLQLNSFATRAQKKDAESQQQQNHAQAGLGVLQALYQGCTPCGQETPPSAVLEKLKGYVAEKKNLEAAFGSLSEKEQGEIRNKIGAGQVNEVLAFSSNIDSEQFWQEALSFGVRLKTHDRINAASAVLSGLSQGGDAVPQAIRSQALNEYNAIVGQGSSTMRGEFLLSQFTKQATDWRVITPMIAGSAVFSLVRATTLGRMATMEAGLFTRGFGARFGATAFATSVEIPIFALGSRALAKEPHTTSVAHDLVGATLTLSALKAFGAGGNVAWKRAHGVGEAGVATRMASVSGFSRGVAGQGSIFTGLMLTHQLEQEIGLRPKVANSTATIDTLSSMVSLGVGAHLGHRMLGPNFARFQAEMEVRSKHYSDAMANRPADGSTANSWLASMVIGKNGFGGLVPVTDGGMKLPTSSVRPLLPAKGSNVAMMVDQGNGEGGGAPPSSRGGGSGSKPKEPASTHLTWLSMSRETGVSHIRVTEEFLPEAQKLWEQSKANAGETDLTASGAFLKTVLDAKAGEQLSADARTTLLSDAFQHFHQHFVGKSDVHAVTRGLPNQAELVTTYHNAKAATHFKAAPQSALLAAARDGKVGLFAQFGGQANAYFGELRGIYETYPEVRPLIEEVAGELAKQARSPEAAKLGFHTQGLDLMKWLENPELVPDAKYLSSSAVSQPLIGLTQLAHYFVNLKNLGVSQQEFRQLLKGATGHSQGVMSGVVVASSGSEAEFIANTKKAASYLLWQGIRMQEVSPQATIHPDIVAESVARGDGEPTAMLGLLKLSPDTVKKYVEKINKALPDDKKVEVSLVNGPRAVVVSGNPESLHRFLTLLRENAAKGEQGRVPFSDRKLEFVANYFPVTAEFHTGTYMEKMRPLLAADLQRLEINFEARGLNIPVFNTFSGLDLRDSKNLTQELINQQSVWPVNWEMATDGASAKNGVTHVLDFGPGETVGIGAITARNKTGTGVQIILAGSLKSGGGAQDKSVIYDSDPKAVRFAPNWGKDFAPKLVRLADGTLMVDTKFTRLLGKPPVMAAGMTPTSANERFVAGVINAGFHGELAGGGQHTEQYFRDRVEKIMRLIPAGEGITSNLLFLNAYLWGFQEPLVEIMAKEGKPMDGITIAAGAPSPENAKEVLTKLREAGIRHVSFKPGNIASIKQVVEIAKENPESTVILQWTGGRGGGHHSFEDMHQPILETYASIRAQKNIGSSPKRVGDFT